MLATLLLSASVALSPPEAADPARSAVVVRYEANDKAGLGSGTVVASEGGWSLVLTNRHVCPDVGVWARIGHGWRRHDAWVASVDSKADLAALMVHADLPATPIAKDAPPPGTAVRQYGHGLGLPCLKLGFTTSKTGTLPQTGATTAFTTIATESGDSGSGLFAGPRLVGVTWGTDGACVPLADVRRFAGRVARESKMFPKLSEDLK